MALPVLGDFAAYLQHSKAVTQFAGSECVALRLALVWETGHPVQLAGCVHRSLPPHAADHLAAVQHRANGAKPDVTDSSTYGLTKKLLPVHCTSAWLNDGYGKRGNERRDGTEGPRLSLHCEAG
ncbi:hypothetical protein Q5P01_001618 [Channa striata]|uniref:Uncharacterized protein n=1 Tax=Channa striata TaxID=64152 RepID=A0AA88TCR9_CHASR|nr:hypothetical protein Q5P01_001618 [Channa striata]